MGIPFWRSGKILLCDNTHSNTCCPIRNYKSYRLIVKTHSQIDIGSSVQGNKVVRLSAPRVRGFSDRLDVACEGA